MGYDFLGMSRRGKVTGVGKSRLFDRDGARKFQRLYPCSAYTC